MPNVGPYIYTTLAFLALLGAPYIYDISSLRVNASNMESITQKDEEALNFLHYLTVAHTFTKKFACAEEYPSS